jgi:glycosyltransferase involved in cell wall biosynthesis
MVPSQDIFPEGTTFSGENVLGVSNQPLVSIVIPALNEAENLPYLLPRIPLWVHEVLLVDGLSTDNTVEVARRLLPSVRIVYQQGRGKGDALLTGFAAATGDIIITLDADGSQNPVEMITFIGALLAGYDYVKGSRFLQGGGTTDMGAYRFLGNWLLMRLVRLLFGGRYTDLCYGYNAFWKKVLSQLQLDASGFEIEAMMNVHALMAGLNVVEVPSFEARRIHGDSHLRPIPDGWRVLKLILKSRLKNNHGRVVPRMRDSSFGHSVQHLIDSPFSLSQQAYSSLCPTCGNRLPLDLPMMDDKLG